MTHHQKQEQDQITVNLNQIYNPHPEILRRYKEKNAMDLFFPHESRYINEERIFLLSKASGSEITHKIIGIYRKKVGTKEYCFFHERISSYDYWKNPCSWTRMVGRYEAPIILSRMGLTVSAMRDNTNPEKMRPAPLAPEIERNEEIHEFEFEKLKPQLIKWHDEENVIDENTRLYIWVDGIKYSKPYTWDEWLNLEINDLVLLGKYGKKFDSVLGQDMGTKEILQALRNTLKEELLASTVKSSK